MVKLDINEASLIKVMCVTELQEFCFDQQAMLKMVLLWKEI